MKAEKRGSFEKWRLKGRTGKWRLKREEGWGNGG
jgi:hypothetical protein